MLSIAPMETSSYRTIMLDEYQYRERQNPSYSLRAFARDLDISPSQLSDVVKGKTGLSSKKAIDVAKRLGLNDKEVQCFKALVEVEHGRSEQIVSAAKAFLEVNSYEENFSALSTDAFQVISDCNHFAILSAMELDGYDGTVPFIATKLNLSIAETEDAIKRLLKEDYIDLKDGKFILKGLSLKTTNGVPSTALRKFHKQHIQKSLQAVDDVPLDLRDITTMTMAIDISKIPAAKEMIKNFRRELCRFMEDGPKNEVYNINIQLIPLSAKDQTCH